MHATYKKLLEAGASKEAHFYICGWKNMVDEARATLTELGIPKVKFILNYTDKKRSFENKLGAFFIK